MLLIASTIKLIFFKALSDETRLKIVLMLKNENLCACHILDEFSITQPTLSYHMKILVILEKSHSRIPLITYVTIQQILKLLLLMLYSK